MRESSWNGSKQTLSKGELQKQKTQRKNPKEKALPQPSSTKGAGGRASPAAARGVLHSHIY